LPKGDWGTTILRQCFFSVYQFYLYRELNKSTDEELAAIAEKAIKEVTYHLRWSAEWVIRLGDGTEESHQRMQLALEALWPYTGELYEPAAFEMTLAAAGTAPDIGLLREPAMNKMMEILQQATLSVEKLNNVYMQSGGKQGLHTEHLGFLLAEMQFLQRAYPGNEW